LTSKTYFESSMGTTSATISSSHLSIKSHQNYHYNEYHEGIIEISNLLLKMLTNQIVDNTMETEVKEK
jgi:hypothetical protein